MGVTIVSDSLILGGEGDKIFKEWRRKIGGVEGWVTTVFRLFFATGSTKKCHFKNCILVNFSIRIFNS